MNCYYVPMRGLIISIICTLFFGCSDSNSAPDGSLDDMRWPDAHIYKLDRGKVTPTDLGNQDLPPPDNGTPGDLGPKLDGGGVLKTHQAPVKLNFDSDNGGLVGNKDWEWKPTIAFNSSHPKCETGTDAPTGPTKGNSGTGMWGTVINGCHSGLGNDATNNSSGSCTNTKYTDDHVLKFRVSIPSSWNETDLIYYHWIDINYPYDWHEVLIDEGSGPKPMKTKSGLTQGRYCKSSVTKPSGWVKENLFLDIYKGKTVTISFHFMDTQYVNKAGWYIDDLEVKEFK